MGPEQGSTSLDVDLVKLYPLCRGAFLGQDRYLEWSRGTGAAHLDSRDPDIGRGQPAPPGVHEDRAVIDGGVPVRAGQRDVLDSDPTWRKGVVGGTLGGHIEPRGIGPVHG